MSHWSESVCVAQVVLPRANSSTDFYFSSNNTPNGKDWLVSALGPGSRVRIYHYPSRSIYVEDIICFWRRRRGDDSPCFSALSLSNGVWITADEGLDPDGKIEVPLVLLWRDDFDDLDIEVTYRVDAPTPAAPKPPTPTPLPPPSWSSFSADFEKLFLDEESSDVAFEIGEDVIPAHKLILKARVPAFDRMFASGMKDANSGRIRIDDADPAAFKQVLKFIYSGKFPEELNDNAHLLLPISDKYGIEGLKDVCAVALKSRISRENVVSTLTLAHIHCCSELKKECIKRLAGFKSSLDAGDLEILKPYPELMVDAILLS